MLTSLFSLVTPLLSSARVIIYTLIAALVVSLIGTTWYYKHSYETTLSEVASLERDVKGLKTSIDIQNTAIQVEVDMAKKKQDDAQIAIDAANISAKHNRDYANYLLSQTPKTGDVCKDADTLINEYLTSKSSKASK